MSTNGLFINFANPTVARNDLATTLAVGEEGGEPRMTTMAVGEEGGDDPKITTKALGEEGGVTTAAVGEEGGPPDVTTLAVGEEGGIVPNQEVPIWDAINANKAADANKDGKTTQDELNKRIESVKSQLTSTGTQINQINQFVSYLQSINSIFGGLLTPVIQQYQQQLNTLNQTKTTLDNESKALNLMNSNFKALAAADKSGPYANYTKGDLNTISQDDIVIAAYRDGNPATLSSREIRPVRPVDLILDDKKADPGAI